MMKFLLYFLLLNTTLTTIIRIDKTKNSYKLCKDCKHFLPTMYGDKFDIGNYMGRCSLYGKINLINGEIEHDYASTARSFDDMCGTNATHFEKITTSELGVHMYPL